jgi:acyl-coenzyme A synthetase/AMP-(fatty) acid ligase
VTRGDGGRWVARTHGDLLEDVDRHAARYRVRAAARVSHLHDLDGHRGIVDLLLPWSVGGTACSPGPDGDLVAWLRDARVSLLRLTPSQLRALDAAGALDAAVLRTVLAVVLEGEGHRGRDVAHLREAAPEALIESVFGRTEAGSSLLVHRVQPGPVAPPGAPTPLGLPFDGVRLAIVDGAGFPVQPGTPGQLAVASSRGQVVRTGDRVKAVKGLGVRHLGRADDMVQLRGRRISLDAVGAVISELAGAPAVVVGWPMAAPGSAQGLVGFVQAESVDAAPVLAAARERLAGGLVPAGLLAVPGLPRLADGRPDRVRLMKYLASRARG